MIQGFWTLWLNCLDPGIAMTSVSRFINQCYRTSILSELCDGIVSRIWTRWYQPKDQTGRVSWLTLQTSTDTLKWIPDTSVSRSWLLLFALGSRCNECSIYT